TVDVLYDVSTPAETTARIVFLSQDGDATGAAKVRLQNGYLNGLTLQPDGKLLLTGTFTRVNGEPHDSLVRLNQDGSLDSSFQAGFGFVQVLSNEVSVMALFPDGRILVKVTDPLAIPISILVLGKDGKFDPGFIPTSLPQPDPIYSSVS